jgi:hypothetical protein
MTIHGCPAAETYSLPLWGSEASRRESCPHAIGVCPVLRVGVAARLASVHTFKTFCLAAAVGMSGKAFDDVDDFLAAVRDAERPMMFDGGGQHRQPNRSAAWVLRCPDRPVWKIKRGLRCAPPLSRQWPRGLIS